MNNTDIITKLRIAMTDARQNESHFESWMILNEAICDAIDALAEQPAQQEPVAWMVDVDLANYQGQSEYRTILAWNAKPVWSGTHEINEVLKAVPLYTFPPAQRTWVGLTDEEIDDCWNNLFGTGNYNRRNVYQAIEAKLRSKNEDRN